MVGFLKKFVCVCVQCCLYAQVPVVVSQHYMYNRLILSQAVFRYEFFISASTCKNKRVYWPRIGCISCSTHPARCGVLRRSKSVVLLDVPHRSCKCRVEAMWNVGYSAVRSVYALGRYLYWCLISILRTYSTPFSGLESSAVRWPRDLKQRRQQRDLNNCVSMCSRSRSAGH